MSGTESGGRGKRKPMALSPAEALTLLESAIGYLQRAGLTVRMENRQGLSLLVHGAALEAGRFVVDDAPKAQSRL